jgi:hypothetical protein
MIRGLFVLIASTLSFLSLSAQGNSTNLLFPASLFADITPQGAYSTRWETVPSWQAVDGAGSLLYTYSRPLEQVSPSVLTEGVVVVFARGYDFEGVSKAEEKPLGLPFYIALSSENAPQPYAWSYTPEESKVTIGLSMNEALKTGFVQAQKDIQLRFFVLTPDFLRQHKLTPMAARNMSYTKLVALLHTAP